MTPEAYPPFSGPLAAIPVGRGALIPTYGDPRAVALPGGEVTVSSVWEREHIVTLRDLPGYEGHPVRVHRLVEPYLREGMRRGLGACPGWLPSRVASFVPRYIRRSSQRLLSWHTWGVAIDFAGPGEDYLRVGANIPDAFGQGMESVGFTWGKRWKGGSRDDMHFQLGRS